MALGDQAPYAPTDAVVSVMETYRDTGLGGGAIDPIILARLGLGDEIARRTIQALRMLGLVNDEGIPTASFTAFKQAPSDSYKQLFADLLYDVYAPIFAVTGKTLADKTTAQVEDAFRTYKPESLRKRMVTLFLGLCQYAGIVTEVPKGKPGPRPAMANGERPRRKKPTEHINKPNVEPQQHAPQQPPAPTPLDVARQKYVDLLLAKAAEQEAPDDELLNRIERALGIANEKDDSA